MNMFIYGLLLLLLKAPFDFQFGELFIWESPMYIQPARTYYVA